MHTPALHHPLLLPPAYFTHFSALPGLMHFQPQLGFPLQVSRDPPTLELGAGLSPGASILEKPRPGSPPEGSSWGLPILRPLWPERCLEQNECSDDSRTHSWTNFSATPLLLQISVQQHLSECLSWQDPQGTIRSVYFTAQVGTKWGAERPRTHPRLWSIQPTLCPLGRPLCSASGMYARFWSRLVPPAWPASRHHQLSEGALAFSLGQGTKKKTCPKSQIHSLLLSLNPLSIQPCPPFLGC